MRSSVWSPELSVICAARTSVTSMSPLESSILTVAVLRHGNRHVHVRIATKPNRPMLISGSTVRT